MADRKQRSMRKGKRRTSEEEAGHNDGADRWLISYADMITLLMVFFIVLFSMSTLDASRYRAIAESFQEAVGGGPADVPPYVEQNPTTVDKPEDLPKPGVSRTREDIAAELRNQIKQAGLDDAVKVVTDERGVVLLLTDSLLFNEGRAEIVPRGRVILKRLTPLLVKQEKPLIIEGHTDNQPISTYLFPSNWELSTTRATNVLRYMLDQGVSPKRLTAAGYADTHPRGSNGTTAGRSENRRVEVVLVVKPDNQRIALGATTSGNVTPNAPLLSRN